MDERVWNGGQIQWVSIRGNGVGKVKEHLFSQVQGIPIHSSLSVHPWVTEDGPYLHNRALFSLEKKEVLL